MKEMNSGKIIKDCIRKRLKFVIFKFPIFFFKINTNSSYTDRKTPQVILINLFYF